MHDLLPYIALAASALAIWNISLWRLYEMPKEAILVVAGCAIFMLWAMYGQVIYLPMWAWQTLGAMGGLWVVRSIFTKFPKRAMYDIVMHGSAFVVALACEFEIAARVIVIVGLLNCVYGILQSVFRIELLKKTHNTMNFYAIGFIGNENMLGTWLVPVIMLNVWLVQSHWMWAFGLPLEVFILLRTHCKTAMLGLGAAIMSLGFLYNEVIISLFVAALIVVYPTIKKKFLYRESATFKERKAYWKVAWHQIKKAPFVGIGFSEFQNRVPKLQRELNDLSGGEFLKPENYKDPWPRRCHNDLLQMTVDHGIIGVGLFVVLVLGSLWSGYVPDNWTSTCMMSAFVGLLVCGLGLHTFYILPTNVMFWFMAVSLLRQSQTSGISMPSIWVCAGICIVALLLLGKVFLFDILFQRFLRFTNDKTLHTAYKYFPTSALLCDYASIYSAKALNATNIAKYCGISIAHYDGHNRLWEAYTNLGHALMLMGAFAQAELCYREALSLWPEFQRAKDGLAQVTTVAQAIQSHKGAIIHYGQNQSSSAPVHQGQSKDHQSSEPLYTSPEPVQQG